MKEGFLTGRQWLSAAIAMVVCQFAQANVLTVGQGQTYSRIEDAYVAASAGDTILVYPQAGGAPYSKPALYVNKSNISFIGQDPAGGLIVLDGTGYNYTGAGSVPRAMFQFNAGVDRGLVANFEIRNCTNDSFNGAAVRINQANNITVRNCDVHDCDMGFMSNGSASGGTATNQLIENCHVHSCGNLADPGYNHNFYMGGASVTIRGCNIHSSTTGHNVKSRAHLTIVEGSFIHDSANREMDLVDDIANTTISNSHALVRGCVIVKDPACAGNKAVIHFGQDGGNDHNGTIHIINSTIVTPFISPVVDLNAPNSGVNMLNTLVVDPTGVQGGKTLVSLSGGAQASNTTGRQLWLAYGLTVPPGGSFTNVTTGAYGYVPPFTNAVAGDYRLSSNIVQIVDAGVVVPDTGLPVELRGRPARTYTPAPASNMRLIEKRPDIGAFEWNTLNSVNTNAPADPVRLVFVHHSSGSNWLDTGNGNLGDTLGRNNYSVRDVSYGWNAIGNTAIGSSTDIGHWYTWFSDIHVQGNVKTRRDNIMASLYSTDERNAAYNTNLCANPGGENSIIVFKSGFTNSDIQDANGTVPSDLYGQPASSAAHTLTNCMAVYREMLKYMMSMEDKMFVVVTAPPLLPGSTSSNRAANARALNNWLTGSWLKEANWENRNVYVFDLYNLLTGTNNHHRVFNSAVQYVATNGGNYAGAYCTGGDNSPTATGNQKATDEFVPLLNVYYNRWMTRRDAVDADGNGLPDRWEVKHFGGIGASPAGDSDNDGLSNVAEFVAGTDPTNRPSVLELQVSQPGANPQVEFDARQAVGTGYAGRQRAFRLESAANIMAPAWSGLTGYTNVAGDGRTISCVLSNLSSAGFFRLKTWLE
ncbi:MAG: hypothetical protein C0404_10255 [Verrucomicrobia bacterium]|nr:hypothetical protein [Verrucomicrobiota bacterium]